MKMILPAGKYIGTVRVGEKGQIVIPKELRDIFEIAPGDQLLIMGDIARGIAIVGSAECEKLMEQTLPPETEEKK